jgi:hypothetical protein
MNSRRLWSTTSRRLAILLLAVVLPPAATLIWLGAQLLEQDRLVIAQREEEGRKAVGQAVALELRQSLTATERLFEDGAVPDGVAAFVVSDQGIDVRPAARLLWTPAPRRLRSAAEEPFAEATRLEYQGDLSSARKIYDRYAQSTDHAIRAGALRRLARVYWRQRRWDDALPGTSCSKKTTGCLPEDGARSTTCTGATLSDCISSWSRCSTSRAWRLDARRTTVNRSTLWP